MDSLSLSGSLPGVLDWAVEGRALPGQSVSGDRHCVAPFPGGALVAVVDGLGHGTDAERAARAAVEVMQAAPSEPPSTLISRCHEGLQRLRGAVMSLASYDVGSASVSWAGVGNVEGVLLKRLGSPRNRRERLLLRGGVVGQSLPPPYVSNVSLEVGDMLVLATDGLRPTFADQLTHAEDAPRVASEILAKSSSGRDDALVLVALYRGPLS